MDEREKKFQEEMEVTKGKMSEELEEELEKQKVRLRRATNSVRTQLNDIHLYSGAVVLYSLSCWAGSYELGVLPRECCLYPHW